MLAPTPTMLTLAFAESTTLTRLLSDPFKAFTDDPVYRLSHEQWSWKSNFGVGDRT